MEQAAAQPYELAFANLPEPSLLLDQAGRLTRLNGEAETLLGPAAAEAARRSEPVARALPWLAPAAARVLAGACEAGIEAEVATVDGRRCLSARLRRLCSREGAPCGAVAVLEDLTEQRALDARLRSAERLAALGTLAASIAHEVNNPLACVVAGLSFVEAEHARLAPALAAAELAEARAALEEARDAALRVGRIVRSLQSFGRPALPLLGEVDLAQAIRAAARLAEPELRGRAQLVLTLAEGVAVRASESALTQLFLALLAQAAPARAQGAEAPALHVALQAEGGAARVQVRVGGAGPAGGAQERASLAASGAGAEWLDLGLALCEGIVSALGGSLTAEGGGPGRDATVRVQLPLA